MPGHTSATSTDVPGRWTRTDDTGAMIVVRREIPLILNVDDVVIDRYGTRHIVVHRSQLDYNCVDITFDTGVRLHETWFEATAVEYDVLVPDTA